MLSPGALRWNVCLRSQKKEALMAHIVHTFKTTFAGEELVVETGRTSELTNGY